ncbi:hypothetical protein L218DRAFT_957432 [Marasmius fiardii PR-910]|nr:hypothetical protein L218DRAFT_957432 [Marasmius fiardii PR-910]
MSASTAGRWTQYDEDAYRLPPGLKRIDHDTDTGEYVFTGGWKSASGVLVWTSVINDGNV